MYNDAQIYLHSRRTIAPAVCAAGKELLRGEAWLPITRIYTPGAAFRADAAFEEVLWRNGQRVGKLEGCVTVLHGPRVVQLPGGFYTELGVVPLGPIALFGPTAPPSSAPPPLPPVPLGSPAAALADAAGGGGGGGGGERRNSLERAAEQERDHTRSHEVTRGHTRSHEITRDRSSSGS